MATPRIPSAVPMEPLLPPLVGGSALTWCPHITQLWLAVARDDGSVAVHDLRAQSDDDGAVFQLMDHVGAVTSVAWNDTMDFFFTAGRDSVINTWSIFPQQLHHGNSAAKHAKRRKLKPLAHPNKNTGSLLFKSTSCDDF